MPDVSPGENLADAVENASSGQTVTALPGEHNVPRTFVLPGGVELAVEQGATVVAPPLGSEQRFITLRNDGCTITGQGVIDGNQEEAKALDQRGQEHIVQIRPEDSGPGLVSDVRVEGVTLQNAPGGDCLYINGAEDGVFRNFTARNGYRNCISIIDAKGMVLQDFVATGASGTPPQSGVGIEPNGPSERLEDVHIGRGRCHNNDWWGLYINTENLETGDPSSIDVVRVDFESNGRSGFQARRHRVGQSRIADAAATNNGRAGYSVGGENIYLYGCRAEDNGQTVDGAIGSGFHASKLQPDGGATTVGIIDCSATDTQSSPTQKYPLIASDNAQVDLDGFTVGSHITPTIQIRDGAVVYHRQVTGPEPLFDGDARPLSERPTPFDPPPKPTPLTGTDPVGDLEVETLGVVIVGSVSGSLSSVLDDLGLLNDR